LEEAKAFNQSGWSGANIRYLWGIYYYITPNLFFRRTERELMIHPYGSKFLAYLKEFEEEWRKGAIILHQDRVYRKKQ
jgi:hypothetical protein